MFRKVDGTNFSNVKVNLGEEIIEATKKFISKVDQTASDIFNKAIDIVSKSGKRLAQLEFG